MGNSVILKIRGEQQ